MAHGQKPLILHNHNPPNTLEKHLLFAKIKSFNFYILLPSVGFIFYQESRNKNQ